MNEPTPKDQTPRRGQRSFGKHIQNNLLAGVLTLIPVVVTWIVFTFALRILSQIGEPAARTLASLLEPDHPEIAAWIEKPLFLGVVSVFIVIAVIYLIGWLASQIVGAKLLDLFDGLITRIPLVRQVYGSIKALINVLQQRPDAAVRRVVMVEFPNSEMKALGFVTRTMRDEATGRDLAAVFVPTTPNPTGGYLEIVPVDRLVSTDWSLDEAMNFVISGGAIAPDKIAYSKSSPQTAPVKKAQADG